VEPALASALADLDGQLVRLTCPKPAAIARHSATLAQLLCTGGPPAALRGPSAAWQEIFSHMTAPAGLARVACAGGAEMMDLLRIAREYSMNYLADVYARRAAEAAGTADEWAGLVEVALTPRGQSARPHAYLLLLCLELARAHARVLLLAGGALRRAEAAGLLRRIFEALFVSSQ
jgi:hypothetical protein